MKPLLSVILVLLIFSSCSSPMTVTANPNSTSATSGTLGSVKASDGVTATGTTTSKGTRPSGDTASKPVHLQ